MTIIRIVYGLCKKHICFGYSKLGLIRNEAFSNKDMWDISIFFLTCTVHLEYAAQFLSQFVTNGLLTRNKRKTDISGHKEKHLLQDYY